MNSNLKNAIKVIGTSFVLCTMGASGAFGATFTIGGRVIGLEPRESLTLLDNNADPLTVNTDGEFTFSTALASGAPYAVTVGTQPSRQSCSVRSGIGKVGTANVTDVEVVCRPEYAVGGEMSGLSAGEKVTLLNNGTDALTLSKDGPFEFSTLEPAGARYDVTVGTQPAGEGCTVTHGFGFVRFGNVTDVVVACRAGLFTIGGTVSGLKSGDSVVLVNTGADGGNLLRVSANGAFTLPNPEPSGARYDVTIVTQPAGETCKAVDGLGVVGSSDVTSVVVSCAATTSAFTIGGTVSGLNAGDSVTLLDDGGDALTVTKDGVFNFSTALASGASYKVTIAAQPTGETCTISNGDGVAGSASVTNVVVACATSTYTLGGTVSGLNAGDSVTLLDDGSAALTVAKDGSFTFSTPLASGTSYKITIAAQPTGQTCTISNGIGTVASANVTNVAVACGTSTFTIGGTVSGLNAGDSVTLLDDGGNALTVTKDGPFTFSTPLANGASYKVTIGAQPTGETCAISSGSGTVPSGNVTHVAVTCATSTFTIGGTVSGLKTGDSVTLLDNGGSALTVSANGAFTFSSALASGTSYAVTIGTQPTGETCTVSNGSGTVASANVTNVVAACATNTFTIGGTVSGLNVGDFVTLLDDAGNALTVSANGAFTFSTPLASGASYKVTISAEPTGETCAVSNGSGTVGAANVTNVAVACATNTFTIGGTVSGLNTGASVTLLDNGGNALTLSANGTFTFPTPVDSGASYAVTVSTQPTGETCAVSNGAGTVASANVTNVAVACSASSSGGGGFWIPYFASPAPSATGGTSGVFVIPSGNLESAPSPQFVNSTAGQPLGFASQITVSDGQSLTTPALMMFAAAGPDGNTHVYGLNLAASASAPTPVQLGNLSITSTQQLCNHIQSQTSVSDPTTLFVVLEVGSASGCNASADTFEVVHYADSATTAPVVVDINTTLIYSLYQDGSLAGLILYDSTTTSLNLYADDTFTSSKQLVTGISQGLLLAQGAIPDGTEFGSNVDYFTVTFPGTATTPQSSALYSVYSSTLAATQIHQGVTQSGVTDSTNLYFVDVTSSTTAIIYQVALTGGTPLELFSGASNATTTYVPLGTNGAVLAFQLVNGIYPIDANPTATVYTVPIGVANSSATTLAGPYAGEMSGFLASPSGPSGNIYFATIQVLTYSGALLTNASYSSVAIPLSGLTGQTPLANSVYAPLEPNGIAQITGITDTDGGWGGGTITQILLSTGTSTVFTTVGGGDYTIPAGYLATVGQIASSTNVGAGDVVLYPTPEMLTAPGMGLAADLTKSFILSLSMPNTNVVLF
jgi:hypothetical protein